MPKSCPYVMMRFLFVLSYKLISEDWFFAEGERFLFLPPSIYPLNRKITKFLIQSLSLFTQNKRRLNPNQSPFLLPFVEMEGIEPSSKRGTNKLSTCLVLTWFSSIGRIKTTNLKLIL